LEAFFLAAIQILVYAGAVMVLFLFVIMMLDIKASERRKFRAFGIAGGVIVAGAFVWELVLILRQLGKPLATGEVDFQGKLEAVVKPLFMNYMLPFQVTALLLLVATVGVVLLSKKETK
jgi:NADH-quinone oxidoreductase subunit J